MYREENVGDLRNKLCSMRTRKSPNRRVVFVKASTPYTTCDDDSPQENNASFEFFKRKRDHDEDDNNRKFVKISYDYDQSCRKKSPNLPRPKDKHEIRSFTATGKSKPSSSETITKKLPSEQTSRKSNSFSGARIARDDLDNNRNPKKSRLHYDQNLPSTTRGSGRKYYKPLKSGETVVRNSISQYDTATATTIPMSYTCLKKLCDDQESAEDASSRLSENAQLQRFEALLQQNEIRYDLMKLIISVIFKVCQSRVPTHLNIILGILNKVRFWSILSSFLVELEIKEEFLKDHDASSIIEHLCQIFVASLDRLPHLYSSIPVHQLQDAVNSCKENGNVSLESAVDSLLKEVEDKCEFVKKGIRENNQVEPPDDFRKLSVFPTREDILKKREPFLRENIIKKPFSSVDQYLDIHFRLLKEDSLAGLRKGCQDLQKRCKQQRYSKVAVGGSSSNVRQQNDVIVYSDVVINEQVMANNRRGNSKGIVFNVQFNSKHPSIKRINWVRSRRLMYGSLVCLISTDFKIVHFATVQDRNPDMLKEGFVQLCFEGHEYPGYDDMQEKYHMVESSSAYFVAYRHILERLQDLREETMPFKNYIVLCKHEVDKPAYLKPKSDEELPKTITLESAKPKGDYVQLLQLVDDDKTSRLKNVSPYDQSTWPDGDEIGLNESQYRAFQSALRREFTVIQGPPGTGKTYLGLKIIHTLLDNCHLWKEDEDQESCPILVLAYTNHALDSFLEGLTIDRKDIIRVGGRSSSNELKQCNINIVRRERRNTRYQNGGRRLGGRRFYEVEREKKTYEAMLSEDADLYTKSFQGILPPGKFYPRCMKMEHMDYLSDENNNVLGFLGISLNPDAKCVAVKLAEEEGFDEFYGHELGGHFYVGHTDGDEIDESKNEVLICRAEETLNPGGLLEFLKADELEIEQAEELEETTGSAGLALLSVDQRWSLYLLWLRRLREYLLAEIRQKQTKYLDLSNEYEELRNIEDLGIMRSSRVVGMTTTCASRNHKLLQQLRPRVVIIEEAAELFEAHVVTCLTKYCQHLILIGDHQQLRPNPSVYNLGTKYSLNVSLLERMIEAGVPYNRLSVQHRMRPEISKIFRHIYDGLEDHTSVTQYENVRGVTKNVFFIDHDTHESVHDNVHSKVNRHEAEFLVELCLYLLRQGYQSSQITILTTYTGQMFVIRDLVKSRKDEFQGDSMPRVSSVDNFQGEENDIILLSLVRNNEEENIGFLKIDNRVCVALSRARKGLYIIGNRKILSNQSPLWKKVLSDFDKSGYIGKSLPLACRNHQTESLISSAENFREFVPNGGCLEKCQDRLECGHACPQMCHPNDHANFKCEKPCHRNVAGCDVPGHKCTKLCHEICDSICQYPVIKLLEDCDHEIILACSDDVRTAKCKERCEKMLVCGHQCQAACSAPCTKKCMEYVKKTDFSCGHENTMACSATQKDCTVPCETLLECEHRCVGKCGQCIQGRVHTKCAKKCERNLICLHQCKSRCTRDCPPCKEKCSRRCHHSQCGKTCGDICIPCREPCEWDCAHHKCTQLCSDRCDRPRCNEPCNRMISCSKGTSHPCRGLCGERCVCTICETNSGEDVRTILFGTEDEEDARFIMLKDCEHIFEYTGLDRLIDEEDREIKPKVCPLCSVPIVRSFRYGNVLKGIYRDIEHVKRKILPSTTKDAEVKANWVWQLVNDLINEINKISFNMKPANIEKTCRSIVAHCDKMRKSLPVYYNDILLLESEMHLLENWCRIGTSYEKALKCHKQSRSSCHIEFESDMEHVLSRILVHPANTSTLILNQLNLELQRLSLKKDILVLKLNCAGLELSLHEDDDEIATRIQMVLQNKEIIEEEYIAKFKEGISKIYARNPQLSPITEEEKIQIVNAIGLKQGHWFKCPNGHYYAIGECGGAMEESKCPECGAVIGGRNHRLADDNELASEMDGASHAAWSDQANMGNYQFDDN